MFTFQITFKSEVCGPEPQFGGNKIPLAAASCIWKSFAKRDRVCSLGKLDVLWERDEVTLAFPQAADVRKEPGELQARVMLAGPERGWGDGGVPQCLLSSARRKPQQEPGERCDTNDQDQISRNYFMPLQTPALGVPKLGVPSFSCSLSSPPGAPSWTHRKLHLQ